MRDGMVNFDQIFAIVCGCISVLLGWALKRIFEAYDERLNQIDQHITSTDTIVADLSIKVAVLQSKKH